MKYVLISSSCWLEKSYYYYYKVYVYEYSEIKILKKK